MNNEQFKSWLAANNKPEIKIPAGTHTLTEPFTLPSNTKTIDGEGSVIVFAGGKNVNTYFSIVGRNGVTVKNMTIKSSRENPSLNQIGIFAIDVNQLKILNCNLESYENHTIVIRRSQNYKNGDLSDIEINGCKTYTIVKNKNDHKYGIAVNKENMISMNDYFVKNKAIYDPSPNFRIKNVRIIGNTVKEGRYGIVLSYVDGGLVQGNTVSDNTRNVALQNANTNVVIKENNLNNALSTAILLGYGSSSNTIQGNVIRATNMMGQGPIQVNSLSHSNKIIGNNIDVKAPVEGSAWGIYVGNPASGTVISDNIMKGFFKRGAIVLETSKTEGSKYGYDSTLSVDMNTWDLPGFEIKPSTVTNNNITNTGMGGGIIIDVSGDVANGWTVADNTMNLQKNVIHPRFQIDTSNNGSGKDWMIYGNNLTPVVSSRISFSETPPAPPKEEVIEEKPTQPETTENQTEPATEPKQDGQPQVVNEPAPTETNANGKVPVFFVLDIGRRVFSFDSVKAAVDAVSNANGTGLVLAFSESEGVNIKIPSLPLSKGLSAEELSQLVDYAKEKEVHLIPLLNSPGHMNAKVFAEYVNEWGELKYTTRATIDKFKDLMSEVYEMFGKPKYFHIGGDEFSGAYMEASNAEYLPYANELAAHVKKLGATPMVWNDAMFKKSVNDFSDDFIVTYWSMDGDKKDPEDAAKLVRFRATPKQIHDSGKRVIMFNRYYSYFMLDELNTEQVRADAEFAATDMKNNMSLYSIESNTGAVEVFDKAYGIGVAAWSEDYPDAQNFNNPATIREVGKLVAAAAELYTKTHPDVVISSDKDTNETATDGDAQENQNTETTAETPAREEPKEVLPTIDEDNPTVTMEPQKEEAQEVDEIVPDANVVVIDVDEKVLGGEKKEEEYLTSVDKTLDKLDETPVKVTVESKPYVEPKKEEPKIKKPDLSSKGLGGGFGINGGELMTRCIEPELEPLPTRSTVHPYLLWKDCEKKPEPPPPPPPPPPEPELDGWFVHAKTPENRARPGIGIMILGTEL